MGMAQCSSPHQKDIPMVPHLPLPLLPGESSSALVRAGEQLAREEGSHTLPGSPKVSPQSSQYLILLPSPQQHRG